MKLSGTHIPDRSVPFLKRCGGKVMGTRRIDDQTWFAPSSFQKGWLRCSSLYTARWPKGTLAKPRLRLRGTVRVSVEERTGR